MVERSTVDARVIRTGEMLTDHVHPFGGLSSQHHARIVSGVARHGDRDTSPGLSGREAPGRPVRHAPGDWGHAARTGDREHHLGAPGRSHNYTGKQDKASSPTQQGRAGHLPGPPDTLRHWRQGSLPFTVQQSSGLLAEGEAPIMALKGSTTTGTVVTSSTGTTDAQTDRAPRTADAAALGQGLQALLGSGQVCERSFSSGSLGFFANGKIQVDGIRYQVSATITRIGTKPGK